MISKEKVLKNLRMSQALLGVSHQEFKTLCVPFGLAYLSLKEEIKHNFTKGRKSILQDIEENLFFILFYLKTYPTYDVLGAVFKMDRTTACKLVKLLAEVLFLSLGSMNTLPANEISDLKKKLKKLKKLKYVIIDGTERPIRRPTGKDLQKEFYSGKKKRHTIKNLILTNKDKAILFLSNTISGKTHDLKVAENTMITSAIPKDVVCILDSGFEGIEKTSKKVNIIKPKKKPKKRELTATQKAKNTRISKKRIFVENAFAGIKRFRITSDVIRCFRKDFKHLVFVLAAGL
ncbi:transposase [Leptospira noguchii]|nr:transposase [Leptospira noguchii]MCH1913058.1 transposase [Leptospira noguchii]MCH1916806.1 transposase [Leptospira noguchii]